METTTQRRARLHPHLYQRTVWDDLDPGHLQALIALARSEDLCGAGYRCLPSCPGDATSHSVLSQGLGRAWLVARHDLCLAGVPMVGLVAEAYGDIQWQPAARDGDALKQGDPIGVLEGPLQNLLPAERVLLNFLQRLSGIATETRRYASALPAEGPKLLDTRKTTPGYRALEKYATACGGGWNHRRGLYDRIMLKDNHLAAAGATAGQRLSKAVRKARQARPELAIEVEVDHLEQIQPVLEAGADVILLDNFDDPRLREALAMINGQALTEASGGITLERLGHLGQLNLDFISTGATIHRAPWADIGLDWH